MDFNKLWQNFLDTVTNHYVDFNGRVGRTQFWYYVLVSFALALIVGIVASIVRLPALASLLGLALFLPNLGMGVRRLHDTGKPAIYIVILLVPAVLWFILAILGALMMMLGGGLGALMVLGGFSMLIILANLVALGVMIYFWAQPGQTGDNQYGPPPPVWTPN
jgi:uncharacterized membrane protein YhaH (DUF805 family)